MTDVPMLAEQELGMMGIRIIKGNHIKLKHLKHWLIYSLKRMKENISITEREEREIAINKVISLIEKTNYEDSI